MFTVCPKCALTLVVTAADLRTAQGYVRCGRCSSVFNALPHLSDERPPPLPETPAPPPPAEAALEPSGVESLAAHEYPAGAGADSLEAPPPGEQQDDAPDAGLPAEEEMAGEADSSGEPVTQESEPPGDDADCDLPSGAEADREDSAADTGAQEPGAALGDDDDTSTHEAIPEEALEFDPARADAAALFIAAAPDPQWTAATGTFKSLSAANPEHERGEVDSAYLASMLRGQPPQAPPGAAAPAAGEPGEPSAPGPDAPVEKAAAPQPGAEGAPHPGADAGVSDATHGGLLAEEPEPSLLSRVPGSVWRIGVPLAVLLLIAQVINHNRDQLAATARFNRPLTALYGALGIRLVPSWDLHAYDVRQLGAEASPAGSGLITVHASIKNAAHQAQPLPLLRVTLQDRFGNRIAVRDVAPRVYLPRAAAALSYLSAGQRIDADLGFVDPGTNAVGFEIDACLPALAGGIACANDSSAP